MEPAFDIQPSTPQTSTHDSRRFVMVTSIILIVLAAIFIAMRIKQQAAYKAYLQTAEGQADVLARSSAPVTATRDEQLADLNALQKSSGKINSSDGIKALQQLQQQ